MLCEHREVLWALGVLLHRDARRIGSLPTPGWTTAGSFLCKAVTVLSGHLCRLSSCDAARLAFHHVRHSCTGGWSRQAVGSVSGKPFLAPGGSKGRSSLSPLPFSFGLSGWPAWPCGPHFLPASFLNLARSTGLSCDKP